MRILLTGARSFVAADIARAFHKQGHAIYTADSVDFDYVRYSRAIQASFRVPSVRFDEAGYIKKIIAIIKEKRIEKIIPLGEEVFYLARNRAELTRECPNTVLHAGTINQLDTLHNKYSFYVMAYQLGIAMPRTVQVKNEKDVISYQHNYQKHVILKPTYSRFGCQQYERSSTGSMAKQAINWGNNYVVQDFIKGEPISSFSFSHEDDVVTYKSALRTSSPGAMANAMKVTTPNEIKEIDRTIRQALGYTGQLGLDFIAQPDGQLYLLEANPRATIGYSLQNRKRVQSRLLMFRYLLEKSFPMSKMPRFMWIFMTYPDLLFRFGDMMPALASQLGGLRSYARFRRNHPGIGMREYASYDMEYNGAPYRCTVTEATKQDGPNILQLLESIPTKGAVRMIYTRRPDAFTSFHSDGDSTSIGLVKDQHGKIVVMGSCVENRYYINGHEQTMSYIGSVRKNPNNPYVIPWLEKLVDTYRKPNKELLFCSIMSKNTHAIEVFTKKRPYMPPLKLIAKYTLFVVNPRQFKPLVLQPDMHFGKLADSDEQQALAFLKKEGQQYDFFPVIDSFQNNHLNVSADNSYVLKRGNKIIGFVCINNQKHKKQFIIKDYAWPLKLLRIFNPVINVVGLMPLPTIDKPIDCPALTLFVVENNDRELFKSLLEQVATKLNSHHGMCMIALSITNHNHTLLNNWHNFKFDNNLYSINFSSDTLHIKHPYTEVSILL